MQYWRLGKIILALALPLFLSGQAAAFIDHFNGTSLGSHWKVFHPNPSHYSVSGGQLHTKTLSGDLWGSTNNYSNLFLINNPYGASDFTATMKVTGFNPKSNWQQIDLVAYDDDHNHVRCINGWVFGSRNWELVYEVNEAGHNMDGGAGHVAMNPAASDFYLRLVKSGNNYTQYYSYDGFTFYKANGVITYGDGSPTYLGILGLQGSGYYQTPADINIDYFEIIPRLPFNLYTFKYKYYNGDSYGGWVYADTNQGYYPGKKWNQKDENGLTGLYEITGMRADNPDYVNLLGKVYINDYYDAESKKWYTPVHKGQAVGTAYLGSELDYILRDGVEAYKFGQGYYEADVGNKYFYRYYYGNNDYYEGYVYRAPSSSGYYPGQKISKKNELGLNGYYEILSMQWINYINNYGQVFVKYYLDGESGKRFLPIHYVLPVGTAYLGSELDYIVKDGVAAYQFGKGYYEADVGDKYTFRYYYGNGDYYQGSVYRAPSALGYYPGLKITKKNELGLNGYYEILSQTWTGDTAKYGKVYVDWYRDGDRTTAKWFRPLNYTSPLGSNYLTSELGYIVSVSDAHKFGQGYWEADE